MINLETALASFALAIFSPTAAQADVFAAHPSQVQLMTQAPSPGLIADPAAFNFGYAWKACEHKRWGGSTFPFDEKMNFLPECAPDTLYSWHSSKTVDALVVAAGNGGESALPIKNMMFFSRTPLSTFGYGAQQVRVKLKKKVKFVLVPPANRTCEGHSQEEMDSSVYVTIVGWLGSWVEYYLCSGKPVESWSTNTPEGLQEMLAERKWVEEHPAGEFDQMLRLRSKCDSSQCPLFGFIVSDPGCDWSMPALERNFSEARDALKQRPSGSIFYAPGVSADEKQHFHTDKPNYFNPL